MKLISDTPPPTGSTGFFKVHKLALQGKKNQPVIREYVHSKDAVCSVVYDTVKNKYIFTKQFRPGPKMNIIEIAAGMIEHVGENEIETMKREILEEIGYETDTINQIVKPYYTTPGKTNERISIYFATVSRKVAQGGGLESEDEEIQIVELTKEEIKRTDFVDGKTLLALAVLKLK
jgi:nudix-type nucleoside diphosphatase (YffH/AdpP family)